MFTRKLLTGLFPLLLSIAIYAVLAGLVSWWYFAGFLSNPYVQFDPSRLSWMIAFWVRLSVFVVPILLWWLIILVVERRRQAPAFRRLARADLWLLLAAILWTFYVFFSATGRLPDEMYNCFEGQPQPPMLFATCGRTQPRFFWITAGIGLCLFVGGLMQRLWRAQSAAPLFGEQVDRHGSSNEISG